MSPITSAAAARQFIGSIGMLSILRIFCCRLYRSDNYISARCETKRHPDSSAA
jgi:hypothetical protein